MSASYEITLTADGHEPFVHRATGDPDGVVNLTFQIWLMGYPERRAAQNISATIREIERASRLPIPRYPKPPHAKKQWK